MSFIQIIAGARSPLSKSKHGGDITMKLNEFKKKNSWDRTLEGCFAA